MKTVNMHVAKTKLSQLVKEVVETNGEIILARAGHPVAKLIAFGQKKSNREPGGWEDLVWMSDDFNDPLPKKVQKYFE